LLDHFFLAAVIKDPIRRILELVLYCKLNVDNIFIIGQHQRFLTLLVLDAGAITDFNRANLRNIDDLMTLDRIRPAPVEAGWRHMAVFSKGQHHPGLALLHDEKPAGQPQKKRNNGNDADTDARTLHVRRQTAARISAAIPVAEQAVQALIEIAPQLVEVRRAVIGLFAAVALVLIIVL
jgi:hypothetical protein